VSIKIKSDVSTDYVTVDPTAKAAKVVYYDSAGNYLPVLSGTYFNATGYVSGNIGASLASGTHLVGMTAGATKDVYITHLRVDFNQATPGLPGLTAGLIGWYLITGATPITSGTQRTPDSRDPALGTSSISGLWDHNAALGWGNVPAGPVTVSHGYAVTMVPPMFSGTTSYGWDLDFAAPIKIPKTSGIVLKTCLNMPATQTWQYTYFMEWFEV